MTDTRTEHAPGKPIDADEIRDHSLRVFSRMKQTPHGPKRSRLAEQHIALSDAARFAEGWNAALASLPAASEGEPVAWSVRDKSNHEMVWDDGGFIACAKDEAEHFAGHFVNHEAFQLYAHPAPSDQSKPVAELVEALEKSNKFIGCQLYTKQGQAMFDHNATLITRARQIGGGK